MLRRRLGIAALVGLACLGCTAPAGEEDPLPTADQIRSIRATFDDPKDGRQASFDVPRDRWPAIRAALTPARRDPEPANWEMLGTLEIQKADGKALRLDLYAPSRDPAAFSIGPSMQAREYYRGGSKSKLLLALRDARGTARPAAPKP